jgi:hypothetical protein
MNKGYIDSLELPTLGIAFNGDKVYFAKSCAFAKLGQKFLKFQILPIPKHIKYKSKEN